LLCSTLPSVPTSHPLSLHDALPIYLVPGWLNIFPGTYVGLAYGTNDANGCMDPDAFYNNYVVMVQAVLNAGDVPIVPTIPWARTQEVQDCGPGLNAKIAELYANFPQVVHGPD